MRIHAIRLNQHGLTRLFGELEARVMTAVWTLGRSTVQDVVDCLGQGTNYKTVMTVMNRLVAKGFLERRKVSRAFVYAPCVTREALVEELSRQLIGGLLADFGPAVLVQLVAAVEEADQSRLNDLAVLVEARLNTSRSKPREEPPAA